MSAAINTEHALLLAIDIGTTACKAGIFKKNGEVRALSYKEYPLIHLAEDFIEQDAELWWQLVKETISECAAQLSEPERGQVKALGISAQGPVLVPLDETGKPLTNAISWLDSRATAEAAEVEAHFGAQTIFRTTGIPPNACFMLPKIMWLKKHRRSIYEKTHRISTCQDFITNRLAGVYVTDHSLAGGSMMYDLDTCTWSDEILAFAGIEPEKLPKLAWAGEVVGPLLPAVAEELGLPQGVLVVLGGHDQECAGIGGGLRAGRLTTSLGTASIILGALSKPACDAEMRIPCLAAVEKDQWVLEAAINVGGAGLRWIRDLLGGFIEQIAPEADFHYGKLMELAMSAEEGSGGVRFYPHMTGATAPYWTSAASGMFDGITLATDMTQMIRAVVEGWGYQIKHNVEIIRSLTGHAEEIVVFGGGAKSETLPQLLANILNLTVLVTDTPETALLGAAMVAGAGCGVYQDIGEAQAQAVHFSKRYPPNPESAAHYERLFRQYIAMEKRFLDAGAQTE